MVSESCTTKRLACVLSGLLLAFAIVPTQAEKLPIRTYTVADGLLRDSITRIRQDSRGFLWFCTADGISRFDGREFTNFSVEDCLPDRHVNDLLETHDGIYLIATDGGLVRLNTSGMRGSGENPLFTVYLPPAPAARNITTLFEDRSGTVWVGTTDSLYNLGEGFELKKVPLANQPVNVTALLQDHSGSLWVGTWVKLFRIRPSGMIDQFLRANGLPLDAFNCLYEDDDGHVWVGLRPGESGGLIKLVSVPQPDRAIFDRLYTDRDGLPGNWITGLVHSSDGKFWVGTTEGLCLWQGGSATSVCKTYTAKNDLCDYGVSSLIGDVDGNLWLGTSCGAKKLARYGFTTFSQADGFKIPVINSIFENSAGQLYASTNPNGRYVSRFDGTSFIHEQRDLDETGGYSGWGWKQTVLQDSHGAWWIPTDKGLVRSPDSTTLEKLDNCPLKKVDTGTGNDEIFRVFEDSHEDIWITTTSSKLLRWDRQLDRWNDLTTQAGFSKNLLGTVFTEDKRGDLWIASGSDTGDAVLDRYRDGQFKVFTADNGVPPGWVRDMSLDHEGRLWLANTAVGVLRIDDVGVDDLTFVKYSTADGLSSNGTYCVVEDNLGRIYVGTGRGLDRLNPETRQVENFTTADGLPGSSVDVAYRDRTGALWFATSNGLAHFIPEPQRPRKAPTVLITGLRAGGSPQPVSILGEKAIEDVRLAPEKSNVSIDFIGLGATLGEKLRYQYRIKGDDWIDTAERTVNFANLSPGNYQFEVRAVSADQLYSDPAVVTFLLDAPLWQQWWFILAISLSVATLVYFVYRGRIHRLLELERVRTRIATDLHDDIGANLTRISILSEVAKQKAENGNGSLLSSIAEIARESVASMNDIVWAVSPEHESLLDMTRRMRRHAEEVFAFRDIELNFDAPDSDSSLKLGVGVRRDLLLVFKEAVNNAARHSGCSDVKISLKTADSKLILKVTDNGRGFIDSDSDSGQGVKSMRRRAAAMGGDLILDSGLKQGTTLKLILPLARAERS